ncbi:MAG: RIP metalloprotease RseP [Clostridiaceae bacterium]|nr:RIP metalloprotease RseP [Clostridiaceae bacterium]
MSILVALIALSLLIIIHELGHFLAAKAVGIKVLEFSLFMGPKLFSFKKGETEYSLRLIPMGGFVKMEGEDEESDDARAFSNQPVWKRAVAVSAGPILNIVFAFILAVIVISQSGFTTNTITQLTDNSPLKEIGAEVGDKLISYGGKRIFDPSLDIVTFLYGEDGRAKKITYFDVSENRKVTKTAAPGKTAVRYRLGFTAKLIDNEGSNIIEMIEVDSPLEKAGIKRGDKIIRLDDTEVNSTNDIINYLNNERQDKSAPLTVTVERDGKILTFENIVPFSDFSYTLGVGLEYRKGNAFEVIGASFRYSVSTIRNVLISLGWLIDGTVSFKELSGPVGIIGSVGSVVESQQPVNVIIINLMYLCAFISINLGVMNLLPIPALDGSHLLILLIEKVRGKPLPQEKVGLISMIGFVLLIFLLIGTLINDIPRFLL